MMRTKYYRMLFTGLLLLASCNDLDLEPKDFVSPQTYYNNQEEALSGLAGVYATLQSPRLYALDIAYIGSATTDEGVYGRNRATFWEVYGHTVSDPDVDQLWSHLYVGINRANHFIETISQVTTIEEQVKNEFLGDAYFLRALYFFDLQRMFGGTEGVPMPLKVAERLNVKVPRTEGLKVYDQIITDLETAETLLPEPQNVSLLGRATKDAARGLLARVYMTLAGQPFNQGQEAYQHAKDWMDKIFANNHHGLNPSYQDLWEKLGSDEYDDLEVLFQVGFVYSDSQINESSQFSTRIGLDNRYNFSEGGLGEGLGFMFLTKNLIETYEANTDDFRSSYNFFNFKINKNGEQRDVDIHNRTPGKYRRDLEPDASNRNRSSGDFPYLRYADVLLMYAEAENELNGPTNALPFLQQVRDRVNAGTIALSAPDQQEELRQLIREERRLELCFEGLRRFDLIRWGILEDKINETRNDILSSTIAPPFHALGYNQFSRQKTYFPIPARQLALNDLLSQSLDWQ